MFESLKAFLINMVAILMISAKLVTLGLFKVKLFWNKCYGLIISVHDVTRKILWLDSIYIAVIYGLCKVMYVRVFVREVIITSIL